MRLLTRRVSIVVAGAALGWAAVFATFGGFDVNLFGLRLRSNDPVRLLLIGLAAVAVFLASGGRITLSLQRISTTIRRAAGGLVRRPGWMALALAAATIAAGLHFSTRAAGGSDAYGYVSEADLWLSGDLKVPQPWSATVPWPSATWTFSPLGYRPAPNADEHAIVPTYSPGLPILLAAAKIVGGQCALFMVVPFLGGVGVFTTYLLGCRLGSPPAGLIAALLVAVSPAFLGIMMEPLSDVPVMAAWALAFYSMLGTGRRSAAGAGVFASLAILIRPNIFLMAVPMGLWFLLRDDAGGAQGWRTRIVRASLFAACAIPSIVLIATLNQYFFGSPVMSGYGATAELYAWTRVVPNFGNYFRWFVQSESPFAVLGIIAIAMPLRAIWPAVRDRSVFLVIAAEVAFVWLLYAAYLIWNDWGYLRFLLPTWPFIMLGLASAMLAAARAIAPNRIVLRAITVTIVVIALGAWQLSFARSKGVFDQRQAARHEIAIGPLVRDHTDPNSVVLTIQRSGSLRYYAGRLTMRYDYLEPQTLDRDIAWLSERGVHAYALLDEHEVSEFRTRFASQQAVASLDWPMLIYEPGALRLFDLTSNPGSARNPVVVRRLPPDALDCVSAEPLPTIVLRDPRGPGL